MEKVKIADLLSLNFITTSIAAIWTRHVMQQLPMIICYAHSLLVHT